MYNIAVIGSKDYISEIKVGKFIKKIKDQFGPTATIFSGGNDAGAERWAKKYSLEFGLQYKEFNPSFTGYRMYSALEESYYGKGFHSSHFYDRYKQMLYNTDRLIVFVNKWNDTRSAVKKTYGSIEADLEFAIKFAEKRKIPCAVIQ